MESAWIYLLGDIVRMLEQNIGRSILQNPKDLNMADIFAILYLYCEQNFPQIHDRLRKVDTFKQHEQRSIQFDTKILPTPINALKPLDQNNRQLIVNTLYSNSNQDDFMLDCYALLLAIDNAYSHVRARTSNISNFSSITQRLNMDIGLGHIYPKPANPIYEMIQKRVHNSSDQKAELRPRIIRTGKESGARLRDHIENFVFVRVEEGLNLDFNRLESSLWLAMPQNAEEYKIALVPLIVDMGEFIIEYSVSVEGKRLFRFTGVKNPDKLSSMMISLIEKLDEKGVGIIIFPELCVPDEVRNAIANDLKSRHLSNVKLLVVGSFHSSFNGENFNISRTMSCEGNELWQQRKMHPYTLMSYELEGSAASSELGKYNLNEDIAISPRILVVRDTPLGRMTILICSDLVRTDPHGKLLQDLYVNCYIVPAMTGKLEGEFINNAKQYAYYAGAATLVSNNCGTVRPVVKSNRKTRRISFAFLPGYPQVWWLQCSHPSSQCSNQNCLDSCIVDFGIWPEGFNEI